MRFLNPTPRRLAIYHLWLGPARPSLPLPKRLEAQLFQLRYRRLCPRWADSDTRVARFLQHAHRTRSWLLHSAKHIFAFV